MSALMSKLGDGSHRAVLAPKGSYAHRAEEDGMPKAKVRKSRVQSFNDEVAEIQARRKAKKAAEPKAEKVNAPTDPKAPKAMSGLDAAAEVLAQVGIPLKVKAIFAEIVARKLWAPGGKTPEATLYSAIITEISKKGSASRFVKTGPGTFGLAGSAGSVKA
jgi:hypothetical protein